MPTAVKWLYNPSETVFMRQIQDGVMSETTMALRHWRDLCTDPELKIIHVATEEQISTIEAQTAALEAQQNKIGFWLSLPSLLFCRLVSAVKAKVL